jgi:hypothetical protein
MLYDGAKGEDATRHVPRGRKRVAARKAVIGLAFLATYVLLSPRFSYSQILRDEWLGKGRLERYVSKVNRRKRGSRIDDRLAEVQLIGIVERTKYYAVWSLAEASGKSSTPERNLHRVLGLVYCYWHGVQWVRRNRSKHVGWRIEHQHNVDRNGS